MTIDERIKDRERLTEEQKERILTEVERERRKKLCIDLFLKHASSETYKCRVGVAQAIESIDRDVGDVAVDLFYKVYKVLLDFDLNHPSSKSFRAELSERVIGKIDALARHDPEEAVGFLDSLCDGAEITRTEASLASAKLPASKADDIKRLFSIAMESDQSSYRQTAAHSLTILEMTHPEYAFDCLEAALEDQDEYVRMGAKVSFWSMGKKTPERAYKIGKRLFAEDDKDSKISAVKSLSTWAKYHHEDAIEMYRQALESGDKELMEAAAVTLKFISSRHPEGYQQFLAMANSVTDEDFAAKRDEQVGILEKKEVRTYNADKLMEHRAAIFYVVSHEEVFRNNREAIGEVLARLYSAGPVRFGKDRRSGSITIRRDRENKQIKRFRRILRLLLDPQHQKMLKPVLRATLEQLVDIDHGKATRLAQDMYEMSSYDDKMICSVLEALAFTDPTEYIRTIEMVWNQGNEDELRGASRSLKALLYSINRPDIEPVKDKEREFLERYLDSGYVLTKKGTPRKESGIIRELSGLVRKEVDYERLSEALEKGLAKNLGQLYRLSHTNIPGLIVFEEIEERGVSSRVYKALDKTVDERGEDIIALKIINREKPEKIRRHEEKGGTGFEEMFMLDIENLQRLSHPNIAKILGKGRHEGLLYLVQTFYTRGSVEQNLTGLEFLKVVPGMLEGLAYLHERGYVHRDIKPANIFISDEGELVIGDLGNSRRLEQIASQGLTRLEKAYHGFGLTHGSSHAAPETLIEHKADFRSDVYSMGLVMARMLTGERYVVGKTRVELKAMSEQEREEHYDTINRALIEKIPEDAPAGIRGVIRRCLAYSPEARYEDAARLKREFEEALVDPRVRAQRFLQAHKDDPMLEEIYRMMKEREGGRG